MLQKNYEVSKIDGMLFKYSRVAQPAKRAQLWDYVVLQKNYKVPKIDGMLFKSSRVA